MADSKTLGKITGATGGTGNQGEFIPQIWSARALNFFHQNAIMASLVNKDFSAEIAEQGDTLNIDVFPNFDVNTKSTDTTVTLQQVTGRKVAVVLAFHDEVSFLVEDVAKIQANVDLVDKYVQKAAIALANKVDARLLGMYGSIASGMYVGNGSTALSAATVLSARTKLNALEVPYADRFLVVDDMAALLGIDTFTRADAIGDGSAIRTGLVGRIYGFDCFEDPRITADSGSPATKHFLAFHRDGITLVTRPLPIPPPNMGAMGSHMDMDGVGIRIIYSYNASYLGVQITLDMLYGIAVINETNIGYKSPLVDVRSS